MNNVKLSAILLLFLAITFQTHAQKESDASAEKLSLNSGTIDNQFEFLVKKSTNWRDQRGVNYEVIRRHWVATIRQHVKDSLKAVRKDLNNTQAIVDKQVEEITSLKTSLNNTQGTLDQTNLEKDSMSLFGMQMSKGGYNGLMWSIIAGLLALTLFFLFKFKTSNAITRQAKRSLKETEEEFEDHRRIALEREQKVRRQLQDEINKQKNNS